MLPITQIVALSESAAVAELGPALLAGLAEVERFYLRDEPRAVFRTVDLSVDKFPKRSPQSLDEAPAWLARSVKRGVAQRGGKFRKTVETSRVAPFLRTMAGIHDDAAYVAIIDQELTPPPGWRYIIFDQNAHGALVSIKPVDPMYWRDETARRACIVKHRVRVACLNVVGTLLGLQRCDNPLCFLYDNIRSVTDLDTMTILGEEHGWPGLANCGYAVSVDDPTRVQEIVAAEVLIGE